MRSTARFPVIAAYAVGVLLPTLETVRRGPGHWRISVATMFEDYVAGLLLLLAAVAASRARPHAPALLLAAWAYVTGMMSSSFWYQLEATLRGADLEPDHLTVLAVKLLLWTTCLAGSVLSLRQVAGRSRRDASSRDGDLP
jgi:hypothetical protein